MLSYLFRFELLNDKAMDTNDPPLEQGVLLDPPHMCINVLHYIYVFARVPLWDYAVIRMYMYIYVFQLLTNVISFVLIDQNKDIFDLCENGELDVYYTVCMYI